MEPRKHCAFEEMRLEVRDRAGRLRKRLSEARAEEHEAADTADGSHVDELRARMKCMSLELAIALCERNYWWVVAGSPRSPSDLG